MGEQKHHQHRDRRQHERGEADGLGDVLLELVEPDRDRPHLLVGADDPREHERPGCDGERAERGHGWIGLVSARVTCPNIQRSGPCLLGHFALNGRPFRSVGDSGLVVIVMRGNQVGRGWANSRLTATAASPTIGPCAL